MAIPKRVIFDLGVVVILHCVGLSMDIYSRPVRRGFHCHDVTLSYEKQENTITPLAVLTGSIFIPMAIMLLLDVISGRHRGWDIYHNIMVFEIGGLLTYVSNNILKYNLGLPRPYFLKACQPDYTKDNCPAGTYVVDPNCTGDENEIKWAGLTFPSLHSSVTGYGLTYFMTFLYRYNAHHEFGYFTSVFTAASYVACLTWAVFVGVSRVLDRRHHVVDVIVGALWGITIATLVILTVKRRFEIPNDTASKSDQTIEKIDFSKKPAEKQL